MINKALVNFLLGVSVSVSTFESGMQKNARKSPYRSDDESSWVSSCVLPDQVKRVYQQEVNTLLTLNNRFGLRLRLCRLRRQGDRPLADDAQETSSNSTLTEQPKKSPTLSKSPPKLPKAAPKSAPKSNSAASLKALVSPLLLHMDSWQIKGWDHIRKFIPLDWSVIFRRTGNN